MSDRRLDRLRQIDATATKAPWRVGADGFVYQSPGRLRGVPFSVAVPFDKTDVDLIVTARNILPATIELTAIVLAIHQPNDTNICQGCSGLVRWPCGQHQAALAVLGRSGIDDPPDEYGWTAWGDYG